MVAKNDRKEKRPRFAADPRPAKKPHYQDPCLDDGHPLAWRFSGCDKGGPFGWKIGTDEKFREVIEKLHEFENKNWNDIKVGGSHPIPVADLAKEARDRLIEIQRDDLDELMSFRLTGPNRVWCIASGHIMRVLWWDEDHQVYPVVKDKGDRAKGRKKRGK